MQGRFAPRRRALLLGSFAALGLTAGACRASAPVAGGATELRLTPDVSVLEIGDRVYLHRSWHEVPGFGRHPSNGLLVLGAGESLLVDTAWTDDQTRALLAFAQQRGAPVRELVVTHSHDDRMGGLGATAEAGVRAHAIPLTIERAGAAGARIAALPAEASDLTLAGEPLEVLYPGPGHAPDNAVVYLPRVRVLFGGCLIKDAQATSLGNSADANLQGWARALYRVRARFTAAEMVVPGHGAPAGLQLLEHTQRLLQAP